MPCITSSSSGSAMMTPTRQPVIRKFFEKLLSVMVRSAMPGQRADGAEITLVDIGRINLVRRDEKIIFLRHAGKHLHGGRS